MGPTIYTFGLDEAIRRGILAPFDYHPIEWVPDDDDRRRIREVYRRAAARKAVGNPMSQDEIWNAIAHVYKTSLVKLPLFKRFINSHAEILARCIVFVETREYGDEVLEIVHHHRPDFHTYYAEDERETLRRFGNGDLECLITCHRLSEGIDIRSLETVILLSAARARLETIQRIGRCLRSDPANPGKRANVVDFIRVKAPGDPPGEDTPDMQRSRWLKELSGIVPEEAGIGH